MKKKLFNVIGLLISYMIICSNALNAATINVAPGFNTLYDAVAAASDGDVLVLESGGIYTTDVEIVLDKPLTIQGDKKQTQVLAPPLVRFVAEVGLYAGQSIFKVGADVTFKDFAIHGMSDMQEQSYGGAIAITTEGVKVLLDGLFFQGCRMNLDGANFANCEVMQKNCTSFNNHILNIHDNWGGLNIHLLGPNSTFNSYNNTFVNCERICFSGWHPDSITEKIYHNTYANIFADTGFPVLDKEFELRDNIFFNTQFRGYVGPKDGYDGDWYGDWTHNTLMGDVSIFKNSNGQVGRSINVKNNLKFNEKKVLDFNEANGITTQPFISDSTLVFADWFGWNLSNNYTGENAIDPGITIPDGSYENYFTKSISRRTADDNLEFIGWLGEHSIEEFIWPLPFNIKPENDLTSYSSDGYPLGDLNWFGPEVVAAYELGVLYPGDTKDSLSVNLISERNIVCEDSIQLLPKIVYKGTGELTYSWSPSAGLSETNIPNPYTETKTDIIYTLTVTSTDLGTVKDSISIKVLPLNVSCGVDKSIICGGKVLLNKPKTNYTGTSTLSYSWLPTSGLDDANLAQPTAEVTKNSIYVLEVSLPKGCIAKDTLNILVNPFVALINNNATVACGNTVNLSTITNYTGSGNLTYHWIPKDGLSTTNTATPVATVLGNIKYSVLVTTPNGCKSTDSIEINANPLVITPSICMVTVDENNKNVVVVNNEQNEAVESFLIYRESSEQADQFDLIGSIPISGTSVFVDADSKANVQSNIYVIAVKDVCGFETGKSSPHKTMHLAINKGTGNNWNLLWDSYTGISVSSYKIYRGSSKSNLTLIASTSGKNNSYTDDVPTGDVYYQLEIVLSSPCANLKSTQYSSIKSNIVSNVEVGISAKEYSNLIKVYPTPLSDELIIEMVGNTVSTSIKIISAAGQTVYTANMKGRIAIPTASFNSGIFIIKLENNVHIELRKVVKY